MNTRNSILEATKYVTDITPSVLVSAMVAGVKPSALAKLLARRDETEVGEYIVDFTAAYIKEYIALQKEKEEDDKE